LGNTFPSVVFFTFGGFWATFGATLTPFFNAIAAYETADGFYDSFAMFLIFMCLLCFIYMIAALRTNICLVLILFTFVLAFPCLAASYFDAARGELGLSSTLRIAGGGEFHSLLLFLAAANDCTAFAFSGSVIAWYLWTSMIMESVDFPIALPVGDLSKLIKGRSEKNKDAV
jgi:uncharacterized protein